MNGPLTLHTRVRMTNPGRVYTQPRVPAGVEGLVVGVARGRRTGELRLAVLWDGHAEVMTANIQSVSPA